MGERVILVKWLNIFGKKEKKKISSCDHTENVESKEPRMNDHIADQNNRASNERLMEMLRREEKEAAYQAYMDYAKGSDTPEEAYRRRGFVQGKDGEWVYKKRLEYAEVFEDEEGRTAFKMITKEGQQLKLTYTGHARYSPNRSSRCGYGSDDWMYLCKEKGMYYLLVFSDQADYGTGWICAPLLVKEYEELQESDAVVWLNIVTKKQTYYGVRLQNLEEVRHLLPTGSRCCSQLTDEHYLA